MLLSAEPGEKPKVADLAIPTTKFLTSIDPDDDREEEGGHHRDNNNHHDHGSDDAPSPDLLELLGCQVVVHPRILADS